MVRKRMKTARCFLHGVLPDATKLMHCYFTVDVPKLAGVIANVPNRSEMHTPLLMPRWIKKSTLFLTERRGHGPVDT